jgi:hypothetical protein
LIEASSFQRGMLVDDKYMALFPSDPRIHTPLPAHVINVASRDMCTSQGVRKVHHCN